MKPFASKCPGFVIFVLLSQISSSQAHSWVEQLSVIASNGTFIGPTGYPRGNVLRTAPGFGDPTLVNLLPPNGRANSLLPTDLMCKSSQTISNQTPGSPALTASPGDMIALRYQENGHVTLPQNQPGKPSNRGTVYIYGTTQPSNDDKFLNIHNVWTADGSGGDKRGKLLATRNYDDGQCYQINNGDISVARQKQFPHTSAQPMGANLWCQTDVILPTNLDTKGTYTLYWVWDWPTAPSANLPHGLIEIYTTCMDINLASGPGTSKGLNFAKGQDLNNAAIESELSNAFIVAPTGTTPGKSNTPVSTPLQATSAHPKPTAPPVLVPEIAATVTVTEEGKPTTILVTVTVQPSASSISTRSTQVLTASGPPAVSPFLPSLKSVPVPAAVSVKTTVKMHTVVVEDVVTITKTAGQAQPTKLRIRGRAVI